MTRGPAYYPRSIALAGMAAPLLAGLAASQRRVDQLVRRELPATLLGGPCTSAPPPSCTRRKFVSGQKFSCYVGERHTQAHHATEVLASDLRARARACVYVDFPSSDPARIEDPLLFHARIRCFWLRRGMLHTEAVLHPARSERVPSAEQRVRWVAMKMARPLFYRYLPPLQVRCVD